MSHIDPHRRQRTMPSLKTYETLSSMISSLRYHLYTLFLFTYSDQKTILFPETLFAIVSSLSGTFLFHAPVPSKWEVIPRVPQAICWAYINFLPFYINNQFQPSGVLEDAIDKPWRPIPSGRGTVTDAKTLMVAFYTVATVASSMLGSTLPCSSLLLLGFWYNRFGGGDRSFWVRNFINAAGFISFAMGATSVASGGAFFNEKAYRWLGIVFAIVLTTVQMQDIPDQQGDRVKNRKTLPLVVGDAWERWSVAVPVVVWSFVAPAFWSLSVAHALAPVVFGFVIVGTVLTLREVPMIE